MAKTLDLEIISPERVVLRETVDYVDVPSVEGRYGILPDHAPMLAGLKVGVVHYRVGGERRNVAIHGGFMEVTPEKTTLLVDGVELPEEIDVAREWEEYHSARRRIEEADLAEDIQLAREQLERAVARLRTAGEEVE